MTKAMLYVQYLTFLSTALLMLLFFYLLILKALRNRRDRSKRELFVRFTENSSAISDYLETGRLARSGIPRRPVHYEAVEEYLLRRLKLIRTEEERGRIFEFASRYLEREVAERLRHPRLVVRLNALFAVESFDLTGLIPLLLERLEAKRCREEERYAIYRILARFRHPSVMEWLTGTGRMLPVFVQRQMLLALGEDRLERLVASYDVLPADLKKNLLDTLRILNVRSAPVLALLERALLSDEMEFRIRALKAAANFGYISDEGLEALLDRINRQSAADWSERMMLARLMGSLRDRRFLPYLEQMIGDTTYLVRIEAAKSISQYRDGSEVLRRIAAEHPDRYARDMAAERLVAG